MSGKPIPESSISKKDENYLNLRRKVSELDVPSKPTKELLFEVYGLNPLFYEKPTEEQSYKVVGDVIKGRAASIELFPRLQNTYQDQEIFFIRHIYFGLVERLTTQKRNSERIQFANELIGYLTNNQENVESLVQKQQKKVLTIVDGVNAEFAIFYLCERLSVKIGKDAFLKYADRRQESSLTEDDFINEALIILNRISRFVNDLGGEISSYVYNSIYHELKSLIRYTNSGLSSGASILTKINKFHKAEERMKQEEKYGIDREDLNRFAEILKEMNLFDVDARLAKYEITPDHPRYQTYKNKRLMKFIKELKTSEARIGGRTFSTPMIATYGEGGSRDENQKDRYGEGVPIEELVSVESNIADLDPFMMPLIIKTIDSGLNYGPINKAVLKLYLGIDPITDKYTGEKLTLEKIANKIVELGISNRVASRERIRQIARQGIRRMKQKFIAHKMTLEHIPDRSRYEAMDLFGESFTYEEIEILRKILDFQDTKDIKLHPLNLKDPLVFKTREEMIQAHFGSVYRMLQARRKNLGIKDDPQNYWEITDLYNRYRMALYKSKGGFSQEITTAAAKQTQVEEIKEESIQDEISNGIEELKNAAKRASDWIRRFLGDEEG